MWVYKHAAASICWHVTPSQHDENVISVRFQWQVHISTFTYQCDDVVPWSENHNNHCLVRDQLFFSPSVPVCQWRSSNVKKLPRFRRNYILSCCADTRQRKLFGRSVDKPAVLAPSTNRSQKRRQWSLRAGEAHQLLLFRFGYACSAVVTVDHW